MNIRDRIIELRRVPAAELLRHSLNWRTHPPEQQQAMRAVLNEVGWAAAVLAYETPEGLRLIDGHLRADIAPDALVPVLVLDVDDSEAEKILATHDPLGGMAGIDAEALAELAASLEFDHAALDAMVQDLLPPLDPAEGLSDPDEVPEPPEDPVTKPGDLWILGDHRLACADSASEADVDRLLDGASIHLVNTDPPYNVRTEPRSNNAIAAGNSSFRKSTDAKTSRMRAKDRPLENDFVSDEEFARLLGAWFGNISRVLLPGHGFYVWGGYSNCGNYPPVLRDCGLYFSQAVIWVKEHPVLTRKDFMGNHEWCFYGWREGAAHRFFGPANAPDVWSVKKVNPQSMVHLTEKPVELAIRAMEYSSKRGENVLDLFAGSGSTLIAAEQTDRRAYLMEIDPAYCDVIVQRFEQFSGKTAQLDNTSGGR